MNYMFQGWYELARFFSFQYLLHGPSKINETMPLALEERDSSIFLPYLDVGNQVGTEGPLGQ